MKDYNKEYTDSNGKIFNLGYDISVFVSDGSGTDTVNDIIRTISDLHDINKTKMNQDIFIGNIQMEILKLQNVYNVLEIKAYNKVGGEYSSNPIEQEYISNTTKEIKLINNTIYSTTESMFEIKYPEKDIRVTIMKNK